jgi:sugar phosphate isomerase/epimerase
MKVQQIAAQAYTVREHLKTPADIAASLKRVREIGYQAVQLSGLGPVEDDELVGLLQEADLVCAATHEDAAIILDRPEVVVERLEKLGCRYTAYPYPGGVKLDTLDEVRAFAGRLNASGKVLYDANKVLAYHNHNMEFRRVAGRVILELLFEETDPRYLQGEIDTYWVQYGGGDPVDWCRRLKGRLPLLHLKDYITTGERQPAFAEVGSGNLNWNSIIAEAEKAGCEWFIVEQDTCPGDPFESLKMSFEYLQDNFCD